MCPRSTLLPYLCCQQRLVLAVVCVCCGAVCRVLYCCLSLSCLLIASSTTYGLGGHLRYGSSSEDSMMWQFFQPFAGNMSANPLHNIIPPPQPCAVQHASNNLCTRKLQPPKVTHPQVMYLEDTLTVSITDINSSTEQPSCSSLHAWPDSSHRGQGRIIASPPHLLNWLWGAVSYMTQHQLLYGRGAWHCPPREITRIAG
jgi:hypothetical protein